MEKLYYITNIILSLNTEDSTKIDCRIKVKRINKNRITSFDGPIETARHVSYEGALFLTNRILGNYSRVIALDIERIQKHDKNHYTFVTNGLRFDNKTLREFKKELEPVLATTLAHEISSLLTRLTERLAGWDSIALKTDLEETNTLDTPQINSSNT